MQSPQNLIWIDLEMTGLEPEHDVIIEMATIVTDSDLNILATGPVIAVHQSDALLAASPDFQMGEGYAPDRFTDELLTLASKWVFNHFGCLSLTLEMPFKDNANLPDPQVGWNGERSKRLGASVLQPVLAVLPRVTTGLAVVGQLGNVSDGSATGSGTPRMRRHAMAQPTARRSSAGASMCTQLAQATGSTAATSSISNWIRAGLSSFQRSNGPTAITRNIGIAGT